MINYDHNSVTTENNSKYVKCGKCIAKTPTGTSKLSRYLKLFPKAFWLHHFAWKACNGILAAKEALFRRRITANNICEVCGEHVETIMHMLCFCSWKTEVWSASKLSLPFTEQESWSFVDTFSRLRHCWEAQPGKLEKWVMICWGIWTSRNEVRHGGKRLTGQLVVRNSLKLLEEFQIANEIPNRVSSDHRDTTSTAQFFRQQNSPALA